MSVNELPSLNTAVGSPLKMRFNFEVSSNKIQSLKSEVL